MNESKYEPVIGMEIHAELRTASKMFCGCPVVDTTIAEPNTAICPVCTALPGAMPVVNKRAVVQVHGLRFPLAYQIRRLSQQCQGARVRGIFQNGGEYPTEARCPMVCVPTTHSGPRPCVLRA